MATMDDNIRHSDSYTDDMAEKPIYKDGDKALDFLRSEAYEGEAQAIDQRKLVRKIDFMVVPLMFCCYCLQYLDKSLLNYASVMGILEDANLDTEEYGTLSLIFYVAFLAFEFPHAYMMQRLPTAKYLGSCVVIWGAVVACTSACNNYVSAVEARACLMSWCRADNVPSHGRAPWSQPDFCWVCSNRLLVRA